MKKQLFTLLLIVLGLSLAARGQQAGNSTVGTGSFIAPSTSQHSQAGFQQRAPRYRLHRGDSFEVGFAFAPERTQSVTVQPDGFVTLKEVGSILAEGKTVPELTESLRLAYSQILRDPVITIDLKDVEKPYFIASGQVAKPGKYDLRSELTVTEAVAVAGGFTDDAKHSQVVLFRPSAGGVFETKLLNVKKLLANRDLTEDVYLQPGDMLYVPKSMISKIRKYIPNSSMGAYYNPASF